MTETAGLRERKRERTHRAISEAAIALFLARGFDAVTVADVAAAAEVSKPTLFKYFPTKEDLVVHRFADHVGEAAGVVRERAPGETPLGALRRTFLEGLAEHDVTKAGLHGSADVLAFQQMVQSVPSLRLRVIEQSTRSETALAEALAEYAHAPAGDQTALIAAAQVIAAQRTVTAVITTRLLAGEKAADIHADAVAAANAAFDLLETGLAAYCG
jgi:AcrR family transcriptional regulator